jgi:hypothetical protein
MKHFSFVQKKKSWFEEEYFTVGISKAACFYRRPFLKNVFMAEKYYDCPYCGATWSFLEIEEQQCFECGYPDPVDDPVYGDSKGALVPDTGVNMPPTSGFDGGFDPFLSDSKKDATVIKPLPAQIMDNYYAHL